MQNSKKIIFICLVVILLIGGAIRFWNLAGHDMVGDDAHYSLRALGYFDYMTFNKQTTPVIWFAEPQWWQRLSFHDAPPLVFAIQWIFFKIGGDSLWAARLPFVMAGTLAILAIFLLGRLLVSTRVGLIAAASLAIMNYHVWISRIGLLESFVILWSILALYFFIKAEKKPIHYVWWAVFSAAGLLTKYTFLFMAPVFIVPLLWWQRTFWKQKWFYVGIAVFFALLSPVIIYNIMVWETRGHFDAALSTMVGMQPDDYIGLTRQLGDENFSSLSFPQTAITMIKVVAGNLSKGFQALLLLSFSILGYLTIKNYRSQDKKRGYNFIWLGLMGALFILTFTGSGDKFTTMVIPFLSLAIGIAVMWLWQTLKGRQHIALVVLAVPLVIWELFFGMQSQWMPEPLMDHKLFLSDNRPSWEGYNALESYVEDFYTEFSDPSYVVFSKTPQVFQYQVELIQSFYDQGDRPQQKHLLVYDDRMDWFKAVWVFERRRLYDVATIPSLTQFLDATSKNGVNHFTQYGFEDVTIIIAADRVHSNLTYVDGENLQNFTDKLESAKNPITEIANPYGEVVFKVFRLPLDDSLKIFTDK